jgi:hypothetical protein
VEDIKYKDIKDAGGLNEVRFYISMNHFSGQPCPAVLDIPMSSDYTPKALQRTETNYDDKSIYKYDNKAPFVQYEEQLHHFLENEDKAKSRYAFPEKNPSIIDLLSKENFFYVYNIFEEKRIRKILKKESPDPKLKCGAFDIDPKAETLIYGFGNEIQF